MIVSILQGRRFPAIRAALRRASLSRHWRATALRSRRRLHYARQVRRRGERLLAHEQCVRAAARCTDAAAGRRDKSRCRLPRMILDFTCVKRYAGLDEPQDIRAGISIFRVSRLHTLYALAMTMALNVVTPNTIFFTFLFYARFIFLLFAAAASAARL